MITLLICLVIDLSVAGFIFKRNRKLLKDYKY